MTKKGHLRRAIHEGEFGNDLATGSAGRELMAETRDREALDLQGGALFSNRMKDRVSFRADRQAITGVFDIAAGVNTTRRAFERTADSKT